MTGPRRKVHVISAGAAQSVVQQVAEELAVELGIEVAASFGAVGAQRERFLEAERVDVVVLTRAMIDELIAAGHVLPASRIDLGAVCGGVAVPEGRPRPDVSTPEALAAAFRAASAIYLPDPAIATAGRQFVAMCRTLGVLDAVKAKLRTFPNGYTAMTEMVKAGDDDAIGCTQITEIKLVQGVELVATLPKPLQVPTVYSLGVAARASSPEAAHEFAGRLAPSRAASRLAAAGFTVT